MLILHRGIILIVRNKRKSHWLRLFQCKFLNDSTRRSVKLTIEIGFGGCLRVKSNFFSCCLELFRLFSIGLWCNFNLLVFTLYEAAFSLLKDLNSRLAIVFLSSRAFNPRGRLFIWKFWTLYHIFRIFLDSFIYFSIYFCLRRHFLGWRRHEWVSLGFLEGNCSLIFTKLSHG